MNTGQIISGLGHLGIIGWVMWGGTFRTDPLPFEVTEVSVISAVEFAALSAPPAAPERATDVALPVPPTVEQDAVATPEPDARPDQSSPEAAVAPENEAVPDTPQPEPEPEVSEAAPEAPLPPADLTVDTPQTAARAVPRQVDRVAPDPVAPPPPEARPADIDQAAVTPERAPDAAETPAQDATAPEEAATEIVTEAEKPAAAPSRSLRPPARRPTPPVRAAQAAPKPAPAKPDTPAPAPSNADAVAAAVAAAMEAPAPAAPRTAPSGPPLTGGERDALRVAVSRCWNVGSLSSDALGTTVTVAVSMTPDGKPVVASIRMIGQSGGSDDSARQAFDTAKRAIVRCGAKGYDLPGDKYDHWKEIEMTFNPERMRIK